MHLLIDEYQASNAFAQTDVISQKVETLQKSMERTLLGGISRACRILQMGTRTCGF